MSKYMKHQSKDASQNAQSLLATVEAEWAERYVEVEVEGISLSRFVCIYAAGFREARERMANGLRTLFRLTPAH